MTPEEFRQKLLELARQTREFQVLQGSGDPLPVTKIAGQPWWPQGIERPKCKDGHAMNFIAQILLSDVPLPNMPENALLSFHYCNECTMNGRMSFGCTDQQCCPDQQYEGYDLTILYDIDKAKTDMKDLLVPSLTKAYDISFRDVDEVPGGLCEDADIEHEKLPKDFPQCKNDMDEDVYPGLKHISKSKIGGWPSWVQGPEWPLNKGERYEFLGQLDWMLFDGTPWCSGGYAYLFITTDDNEQLKAEMLIQVT